MWQSFFLVLVVQQLTDSVGNSSNCVVAKVKNSDDLTDIIGLQDIETPRGEPISAIYKQSFAYKSMRRLPSSLQILIDSLTRDQNEIIRKFGAGSLEDLQHFVGNISELRSDVEMNKNLTPLPLAYSNFDCDVTTWNNKLKMQPGDSALTFFKSPLHLTGSYVYRRMNQALARTKTLTTFDPFEKQKQHSLTGALKSLTLLANYTLNLLNETRNLSKSEQKDELAKLLKISLWGNKFDLMQYDGAEIEKQGNPVEMLSSFEEDILIDDTEFVWNVLNKSNTTSNSKIVDIVLDNAGFELFTDLCIVSFLMSQGLARKVRFYVKRMPWLISDVNHHDFMWTVQYLQNSSNPDLKEFGDMCAEHLNNNDWTIEIESFWTEPFVFGEMKKESAALYGKLSEATLIVFKGDFYYHKLIDDINWDYTTTLETVLFRQNFRPTSLVSLRTLKSDICVGLAPGKAGELREKDVNWMITGKYGIINAFVNDLSDFSSNKE